MPIKGKYSSRLGSKVLLELIFNASGSINKLDTKTVAMLSEALTVLEKHI